MDTPLVTGLRRTFEDWHHEQCDTTYCEKAYCRTHRTLYWTCQDLQPVPSRVYCEEPPFTTLWEGEGECLKCKKDSDLKRYMRLVEDRSA